MVNSSSLQLLLFTTYTREGKGIDDAQQRRYNRYYARFEQPDPFDGSYNLTNPQSLNRYSYTENDPVNFIDPSGLNAESGTGLTCYIVISGTHWDFPDGRRETTISSTRIVCHGGGAGSSMLNAGDLGGGGQQNPTPKPSLNCGVNPITNKPGINPATSGRLGELRTGIGGDGRFNSRGGRHQGIDIRAPLGTSVHANRDGVVTMSQYVNGYGNIVILRHSENAYTLYAHLQSPSEFKVGSSVSEGEVLGLAGRTGNVPRSQLASEDHLHFGFKSSAISLRKGEKFDDPVKYLNRPCP